MSFARPNDVYRGHSILSAEFAEGVAAGLNQRGMKMKRRDFLKRILGAAVAPAAIGGAVGQNPVVLRGSRQLSPATEAEWKALLAEDHKTFDAASQGVMVLDYDRVVRCDGCGVLLFATNAYDIKEPDEDRVGWYCFHCVPAACDRLMAACRKWNRRHLQEPDTPKE